MRIINEKSVAYGFAAIVLVASLVFAGSSIYNVQQEKKLRDAPVDVLKNWTLTVDSTQTYHPGDSVTINSKFIKLLDNTGNSSRFIQCVKPQYAAEVVAAKDKDSNYRVPEADWDGNILLSILKANRPKTVGVESVTATNAVVPLTIINLPNYCRIYISVTYNVNRYHPAFQENNTTNDFRLEPRSNIVNDGSGQTYIYTDFPPASASQVQNNSISADSQQPIVIYTDRSAAVDNESAPTSDNGSDKAGPVQRLLDGIIGGVRSVF